MLGVNNILQNCRQVSKIVSRNCVQVTLEPELKQIQSWIQNTFNTDRCDITIMSKSGGYVGDVIFAKATVNQHDHHLAIKVGKTDAASRKLMPIQAAGRREILFYNEILPIFKALQKEKNVQEPFEAVPKCYKTFQDENTEVIILENMTKKGFEIHKGSKPLNINHLKLGFKNFAKFHALSFALRDQKLEIFKTITKNSQHIYRGSVPAMKDIYAGFVENALKQLNDAGMYDLSKKYQNFVGRGAGNIFLEIYDTEPAESVVTHCDCHNNNFFFKYEDHRKENPSQMKIIDFQISCLHSPVLDLSYFWYAGASKNEFPHFKELLEFYHNELSQFLNQLGSDPNKIFPLSKLWEHWDKYSKFGFLMSSLYLDVLLFKNEEKTLEVEFKENVMPKKQLRKAYNERLVALIDHYFKVV